MDKFVLHSNYKPTGDQPQAIEQLVEGLNKGLTEQTLLGVTGDSWRWDCRHSLCL